jgi:molybdopterin molybdotransferase
MTQTSKSELTPIDQALRDLLAGLKRIDERETVPILEANGRILAQSVVAAITVPPHDNSAMDGYAVTAADVVGVPVTLPVTQRIAAGQVGRPLVAGEAARIFTGAPMPAAADAVVMQENCRAEGDNVRILQAVKCGQNVRRAGEDIEAGTTLFAAGHRLRSQDIGLIAALGISELALTRRMRVALMTTGDELVQPGTKLKPGQIYNSNFYSLSALLQVFDAEVVDVGVVSDDFESTRLALASAAESVDCIISTGGVSVGEEDHVKAAVEAEGYLDLWKLAIKPGKPLACGKVRGTQFFGLPGNPVSAVITFLLVVRPCLLRMSGCDSLTPMSFSITADFTRPRSGQRQEYLRATLPRGKDGSQVLRPFDNQSSGVGSSLSLADGLAIIPPYTSVAAGDSLEFIPFSELLN